MLPAGADPGNDVSGNELPDAPVPNDGAFGGKELVVPAPELLATAGGVVMLPGVPPVVADGACGTASFPAIDASVPADAVDAGGTGIVLCDIPGAAGAAGAVFEEGNALAAFDAVVFGEGEFGLPNAAGMEDPCPLIVLMVDAAGPELLVVETSGPVVTPEESGVVCANASGVAVNLL